MKLIIEIVNNEIVKEFNLVSIDIILFEFYLLKILLFYLKQYINF